MSDEWKGELAERNPEARTADGFDDAFIGVTNNPAASNAAVAVYSRAKCVEILMGRDGMSQEDADEFFEFNVAGAYVGPFTPLFVEELV